MPINYSNLVGGYQLGAGSLQKGRLLQLRCPLIVCTSAPLQVATLSIPLLATASYRPIGRAATERLANRFQPRLLDFRLRRRQQVAASEFDVADFACEARMLAMTLGSVFEGEPELQARLVEALRPADESWKSLHAQADAAIVLEVLLVACHEDRLKIYVGEITDMANALLMARQAKKQLSAEAIGRLLRGELGLFGKRDGPGIVVLLDRAHRERIHQLAQAHHTLSSLQPKTARELCDPSTSADEETVGGKLKVIHNIQDLQAMAVSKPNGGITQTQEEVSS